MMKDEAITAQREAISALADGQLQGDAFACAVAWAGTPEGRAVWQTYHTIGEVLRASETAQVPAQTGDSALLERLRQQLAAEPQSPPCQPVGAALVQQLVQEQEASRPAAANDASVWRWRAAAGCISLVAALGWGLHFTASQKDGAAMLQAGVAARTTTQPTSRLHTAEAPTEVVANASSSTPQSQVMMRDPRLDELLAAHRQFSGTNALQMPAGFLRNATFEAPKR